MMTEIKDGYVKSHTEHAITTIEFYHPQSNSLPLHLLDSLSQEIHYAGTHDSKVVVLQSAGNGAFCAGASFNELLELNNEKDGTKFFSGFANVINAMRNCPKLIVGRIHGKCVGGGVGIAAAVDYAIAYTDSEIRLSEFSLGLGPFVIGPAVERKIGTSAFSQLAIDSTLWRNADWAKKKGLYAEVHQSIQNMDDAVYRLSNILSHSSQQATIEMKKLFWHGTENWDTLLKEKAAISAKLAMSQGTKMAIENFRKKIIK
ncbi:MAG TPA: enoyl-CoA hydratase/isomerase family protein [Hanamia sp.]